MLFFNQKCVVSWSLWEVNDSGLSRENVQFVQMTWYYQDQA